MSIKRVAAAAAVAAGLGASVTVLQAGLADSLPMPRLATCRQRGGAPPRSLDPASGAARPCLAHQHKCPAPRTRVTSLPPQVTTTSHGPTEPEGINQFADRR